MIRSQPAAPRGGAALAALASRLTDRDRLQELRELRLLASFRPAQHAGQGSAQNHWVLDEAGALVVAAELGLERTELRWRAQAALAIASSSKLAHQLAVNEFFTRLADEAKQAGGALDRWWGERRSRDALNGIAMPDGYGRL